MVPGLTISVEGVGNTGGGLDAIKITFNPDELAIEVAEEQQILANKSAGAKAQISASDAQATANNAQSTAGLAVTGAAMDMAAVQMVNQRVSDLDDYNKVAQAVIYYPTGQSTLDDATKADLDKLAALAMSTDGYMIEIAGYASKTGAKSENQQLSEDRAEAVANYLRNQKNIPMRRILAPDGYGATHPDATNRDPQGRELNRRVDVTLLVNKGLQGGV
jgi:outer membrane protein OmpA-like peptidoglycan-associated protein